MAAGRSRSNLGLIVLFIAAIAGSSAVMAFLFYWYSLQTCLIAWALLGVLCLLASMAHARDSE